MSATVNTYSKAADGEQRLQPNFRIAEFACRDGSDKILLAPELVRNLQAIRDHYQRPVKINSGYRTPSYNRRVGGVKGSFHTRGLAADFRVEGIEPWQIKTDIDAGWVAGVDPDRIGLGYYPGRFIHIDVRGHRGRWQG